MMRMLRRYGALVGVFCLGACEDELVVTNPDQPDEERVLATPGDAENLMGSYYRRWHDGLYRTTGNIEGMANIMSFQNYSSLANNCQNQRTPFSGAINDNSVGNTCGGEQQRVYYIESEVNRVTSTLLRAMEDGLTLGSPARDNRYKAFGEFLRGVSLGYIALFYDSAAVVSVDMEPEDPGELSDYKVVMDSALAALQRSIDHATAAATGSNGFPLPATWIPSPTSFTAAEFVRLIRSYRARFRANVARTPAEREAVNWDQVIADVQNGITADHLNTTSTVSGPFRTWMDNYSSSLWHQMPPFVIGMADVSGSYAAWIATPVGDRGAGNQSFFMVTPDLRFPQGATRAAQRADFPITSCEAPSAVCKRYFVNRQTADQFAGVGWGWSNYDHVRYHPWRTHGDGTARNGNAIFMTKTEMDMLEAEGHIRKGNYAAAAALINQTRTKNGLPAITAFDATSPVPGGATNCVPKFPQGSTVTCGNILEAMKYEKRIETAYTHFAAWFLDMRGWGDLAEGTPLFWAVPYQDLQARGYATTDVYSTGNGVGTAPGSFATRGTYGW